MAISISKAVGGSTLPGFYGQICPAPLRSRRPGAVEDGVDEGMVSLQVSNLPS
jgi:hypothetical protein